MSLNRITRLHPVLAEAEQGADSARDRFLPEPGTGEVLRGLGDSLRRRWPTMVGLPLIAVVLAVVYVLTATPLYTANGSLLLDPRVGQSPEGTAQMLPGLLMSDALTVDSELRVLTSREVTGSALRALDLPEEPPEPSLRQRIEAALGLGADAGPPLSEELRAARRAEAQRQAFLKPMEVERAGDTFVIDVTYTSPDPAFAALAVNTLMQEYRTLSGSQQIAAIERNQTWLSGRVDELRAGVAAAETAVADFRRTSGLLAPDGQLLPSQIALGAVIEEQVRLRSEAVALAVQAEQLAEQLASGDVGAVRLAVENRSRALDDFEARYAELQQQEKELLLLRSEDDGVVLSVRRQQVQTRDLILGEYRQALDRLRTTGEALDRQVAATETVVARLREDYGEDIQKTVELRSLEREAAARRGLYERLLEDYNSASQLLTFDATSARVIGWAVPPDRKSAPNSRQIVVLAAFAGLVLAATFVFLADALDTGLRTRADVTGRDASGAQVPGGGVMGGTGGGLRFLGLVPAFGSEKTGAQAGGGAGGGSGGGSGWWRFGRRRPKGRLHDLPGGARWLDFAVTHPGSGTADTLRMVHAQLALERGDTAGPGHDRGQERGQDRTQDRGQETAQTLGTVIGLTSSVRGEGKTVTAANLAGILAQRQERVALVDLDVIARGLSRAVGPLLPAANDLAAFLNDPGGAVARMEEVPEMPGLAVIGNVEGRVPAAVTPRGAERIDALLQVLRGHFDYVVVDLPPAESTADTQLLAALCDRLLWVVRWGTTPRDRVAAAIRQPGLGRGRIFGVLYTRAKIGDYRSWNRRDTPEHYA